jgi:hypothetical protein
VMRWWRQCWRGYGTRATIERLRGGWAERHEVRHEQTAVTGFGCVLVAAGLLLGAPPFEFASRPPRTDRTRAERLSTIDREGQERLR